MPEERRRRSGESEYEDPREQSFIKKAAKMEFGNPTVDALVRAIVMLAMSGGAGYVTSENKSVEIETLKTQIQELKTDQASKWKTYYTRRREAQAEHLCYERRFVRLEVRAGIEAPGCATATAEVEQR